MPNEAKHMGVRNSGTGAARGPGMGAGRGSRGTQRDRVLYPRSGLERAQARRVYVCVDDTDDITAETSTGYVSEQLAQLVCAAGGEIELGITRHQLYLGSEIAYTSHNSAMCFVAWLPKGVSTENLRVQFIDELARACAASADPGLCVWDVSSLPADQLAQATEQVMVFGQAAQERVCTKEEAYALAESISGLTLSEHGGTGEGVIGALAGVGLRATGADGRFRGMWNLARIVAENDAAGANDANSTIELDQLTARLEPLVGGHVRFYTAEDKRPLPSSTPIALNVKAKPVFAEFALCFPCTMEGGVAYPSEKIDLGGLGASGGFGLCDRYVFDNDAEEADTYRRPGCRNCLYRRWTARGFTCVIDSKEAEQGAHRRAGIKGKEN